MRRCFHCQKELLIQTAPALEAVCPYCATPLHGCFNCKRYTPDRPLQCSLASPPVIRDKHAANACPDFISRDIMAQTPENASAQAMKKIEDLFRGL